MKKFVKHLIALIIRAALWFRYKVTVKGLEKLTPEYLNKSGGVLFLPNHTAVFVDPALVSLAVWPKFPIRPMIVEYQFYAPYVNRIMPFLDALPVPSFNASTNSLKRNRSDKVIQTVIQDLRGGQNFLIYPAGKTKSTDYESIGGASAVPRIISEVPEANIVLVRVKGLWGSSFSRAVTGTVPPLFPTIWSGMKHAFKNLLFFSPRRHVTIEFEPAPADFPQRGSRIEINRYLEEWFNKPDGLSEQKGDLPGDSLIQVSYSLWKNEIPKLAQRGAFEDEKIDLKTIPNNIKQKVIAKIAEMTQFDPVSVKPEMNLAVDLGLDSIDIADLGAYFQDEYDLGMIPFHELTTVGKLMALAAKQVAFAEEKETEEKILTNWKSNDTPKARVFVSEGRTVAETFLNTCDALSKMVACADHRTGVLTYQQLKMRALLVADYIRKLPGKHIGILLPASVGAELMIIATQLAGKIPLMVNWTVGPRHLESVKKLSNVQTVLTSWAFIDNLENVDLNGIEDNLVMLEEVRSEFTLMKKIKAYWMARKDARSLMRDLELSTNENDEAALLFTSGSESLPKGVPLTHKNLLSNQRDVLHAIDISNKDILLAMLPPFHSFGFLVDLLCLTTGIKTFYYPDPKDGKQLAKIVGKYGVTIMGGTPTFIKSIMKAAKPEQLTTARFCFTGAEKAPAELFQLMRQFGKTEDYLVEGYGITECSPVLTCNRIGEPHKGVGKALPSVELCVVHPETYELLPSGQQGLILARGPNIFSKYLNPGLSSPFIEVEGKSWYKTGDLGSLDEQGYLTISGRLKRFIKIGAEMVSLQALEEALMQEGLKKGWKFEEDGVSLAICAKEYPGEKTKVLLFTIFDLLLEDANRALKEAGFSNLVRISQVIRLPVIPIMGTGKTNYRLLESDYLSPEADKTKEHNPSQSTQNEKNNNSNPMQNDGNYHPKPAS